MVEGIEETKRIVHHEAIPQGIHYPGNGIGDIDSDLGEGLGRDIWWQGGGDEQVRADQMFQGLKSYFLKNMKSTYWGYWSRNEEKKDLLYEQERSRRWSAASWWTLLRLCSQ